MSYQAGFELSAVEREQLIKDYYKQKNFDRFVSVRSAEVAVEDQLQTTAGVPLYYSVGFDRKGRQYMGGYPLNPQGSKETRPLFVPVTEGDSPNPEVALEWLELEGSDLFDDTWESVKTEASELVSDYMNPRTIAACSTKGTPDIAKFALLREYVKLTCS